MTLAANRIGLIAALRGGGGGDAYDDLMLADNPVAYFRLNDPDGDPATDATGNGHDGIYVDQVDQQVAGLIANDSDLAADFRGDENGGHVEFAKPASLSPPNIVTYEAWINPRSGGDGGFGRIVYHQFFDWWMGDGGGNYMYVEINGTNVSSNSGSITKGAKHHVVVTYESGVGGDFYLDGQNVGSIGDHGDINTTSEPFNIGGSASQNRHFDGIIDEVAIYDYILTPTQVTDHYNAGL